MSRDDRDGPDPVVIFPWAAALFTVLAITFALLGTIDGDADEAPVPAAPVATAPATTAGEEALPPPDEPSAEIPAEVADDPVVQRLARGRELPFTAGPWARRAWRDRVLDSLRPVTRARAARVAAGRGFGIRIR